MVIFGTLKKKKQSKNDQNCRNFCKEMSFKITLVTGNCIWPAKIWQHGSLCLFCFLNPSHTSKLNRKVVSDFPGKIVGISTLPPFFLWQKCFFFEFSEKMSNYFFNKIDCKKFSKFFSMNSAVKKFRNFFQ